MKAAVGSDLELFLRTTTAGMMRHIITVTPKIESPVYWTDHSSDIVYNGETYYAGGQGTAFPIPIVGGHTESLGLEITEITIRLLCGGVATIGGVELTTQTLNGALDGAWVKIERLYGTSSINTSLGALHVFEGRVAQATPSDNEVELVVESGVADLNVLLPRVVFQPGCGNILFDAQCGLTKASFKVTSTVNAGATTTSIPTDLTQATGTTNSRGWFALGYITFDGNVTGALAGVSRGVRAYSNTNGTLTLDRPLDVAPGDGDEFDIWPGCPKSTTACANNNSALGPQFNNLTHFRGFPFVPKNEQGGA